MMAELVRKNGKLICGCCRMIQSVLKPQCWFCEAVFSNFESIAIDGFVDQEIDKIS